MEFSRSSRSKPELGDGQVLWCDGGMCLWINVCFCSGPKSRDLREPAAQPARRPAAGFLMSLIILYKPNALPVPGGGRPPPAPSSSLKHKKTLHNHNLPRQRENRPGQGPPARVPPRRRPGDMTAAQIRSERRSGSAAAVEGGSPNGCEGGAPPIKTQTLTVALNLNPLRYT